MKLTEKMEQFMNDLIGKRMEEVYQEKNGEQYDPFNAEMERKMQKLMQELSPKKGKIIFDLSNKCSDLSEFYYRMGLRDGLMLKECIKTMLDAVKE